MSVIPTQMPNCRRSWLVLPPLAALALGALTSAALFLQMQEREYAFEKFRFELAANASITSLQRRLDAAVLAQENFGHSIEAFGHADRERFLTLTKPFLADFPFLLALTYEPIVAAPRPHQIAEADAPNRFMVSLPVYRPPATATTGNVNKTVVGHTFSVIDTALLMEQAFAAEGALDEFRPEIRIYAGPRADASKLVYQREGTHPHAGASMLSLPDWLSVVLPPFTRTIATGAEPWHVVLRAQPLPPSAGTGASLLTLLAGGLFSFALAALMQTIGARSRQIQRMVDERTLELSALNERLVQDIAARQRVEQELLHTQQVLTLAQKVAHLGSWELDAATGMLQCSDELYRICGLRPQSINTTMEFLIGLTHPDDRDALKQAISATRYQGKDFRLQSRIVRPDGSIRHVISIGEATRDEKGQLVKAAGSLLDVTEQKESELALRRSQDELRRLAAHEGNIREDERKRIAREVHDELGGLLTGIKVYLSVLLEQLTKSGKPSSALLTEAASLADQATDTVRKIITDLRPSVLDQLGVWAALQWYAEQTEKRTGISCDCTIDDTAAAVQLDPERSTAIFRIVQETLTNIARHAQATHAAIRVTQQQESLLIEIKDDGVGLNASRPQTKPGWGIVGMQERARHFGGEFVITDAITGGAVARLWLPINHSMTG